MDSANYKRIVAQIKNSCPLSHHIYPSYNLLSTDTLIQLSNESNFFGGLPFYVPFEYEVRSNLVLLPGSNPEDDAADLVKKKLRWEKTLGNIEPNNLNSVIETVKSMKTKKPTKVPARVRKYVEHFCSDPEPYFNGSYNWLYTGGTLTSIGGNDETALICVDHSGKKPGFNVLKLSDSLDRVEYNSFYQLKTFSPILQIACNTKPENFIVCVRQKNQVSLFRFDGTAALTQPTKLWRKKTINDKIITSVGISVKCEEVAVSDSNYDIHVIDIESGLKSVGYAGKTLVPETAAGRWGQVSFGDLGLYVAFRDRLHVLDVRDANARPQMSFDPSPSTNDCEGISCVTKCIDSNYLYLATTHHLLQVDLRNGKPVQRWTHLMSSPPQFVSSIRSDEQELLVLQSWKVDELVGVTNGRVAKECFLSKSLPCLLRSVKESLRKSRREGMCLSPALAKRLDFAVTGVRCLQNHQGEILMFVQNSGGDIFLNKIRKKVENGCVDQEEEKQVVESLKALESHLEKSPPKRPEKTLKTVDMSHVLEGLELSEEEEKPLGKPEACWEYEEMFAPESLSFCQDVMAQNVLKVWGYGSEESEQEDEMSKSREKVLEWMAKI